MWCAPWARRRLLDAAQQHELEKDAAAFAGATLSLVVDLEKKYPTFGELLRDNVIAYESQLKAILGKDGPEMKAIASAGFQLTRRWFQDRLNQVSGANVRELADSGARQVLVAESRAKAAARKAGHDFAKQISRTMQSGSKAFENIKGTVKQLERAVTTFVSNPERTRDLVQDGKTVLWNAGKAAMLKAGSTLQAMASGEFRPSFEPLEFLMPMMSTCGPRLNALELFDISPYSLKLDFNVGPIFYDSSTREQTLNSGGSIHFKVS